MSVNFGCDGGEMQFEAASSCAFPKQRCDEEAAYKNRTEYMLYPSVETKLHSNMQRVRENTGRKCEFEYVNHVWTDCNRSEATAYNF